MDLETFVSQSLLQIVAGVRKAQEKFANNPAGAKINPRGTTALGHTELGRKAPHEMHTKLPVHQMEFDIALTTVDSSEGTGSAGLRIMAIGIGGELASRNEASSVSRVKFSVPIVWPDPDTIPRQNQPT
ncbi:MAG: hypothetical protein ABSD28_12575 [Tepidisphaeraceae bacterium]|jgi:hypothetical protein